MDVTKVLPYLLTAIGISGGVAALLNGSRKDGLISVLTQENSSLRNQVADLQSSLSTIQAQSDGFKQQAEDLKELAQGSPQLVVLTKAIDNQTAVLLKIANKRGK